jgi:hypothetical protein
MRKITIAAVLIVFLAPTLLGQQMAPTAQGDLGEVRSQLSEALQLLQQTRKELQDSQAQLKELRSEVDSIKASLATPASATQASSETSQQVEQLTETQALSESRLEQIYQTKVESGSKYRVKFSGLILFNAGVNRGAVDNADVPMMAARQLPGQSGGSVSATMRQTMFDVGVTGPDWLGARTSADVQFDFFGGFPSTVDGNAMGIMRLRTAHSALEWENGSLMVEQEQPFISPLSPTSLATLGTASLGYSGNLWTWTPQIVATRKLNWSDNFNSTVQFGVMDPFSGEYPPDQFERSPEAGERSRVPAIAARHAFNLSVAGRKFTIGTSGMYSRHDYGFGRTVNGYAATVDWMLPFTSQWELSGEFFRGRAIGGLWGGVGTSVAFDGPQSLATSRVFGVNTIGGWTQLKFKPAEKWEVNSAFGIDNPFSGDLKYFATSAGSYRPPLRNSTEIFNVIHHPRSNLVLSIEYRHLNTVSFFSRRYTAENVNLGIGVHF